MSPPKVTEHPNTKLLRKVQEQEKKIRALEIDVVVLRDLLLRTVRMLAKVEAEGWFGDKKKKGPKLLK
jgi:hypothetical protein